jgi:hypothetical protein
MHTLQTLLNAIQFDALPPAWTTLDLARFSQNKKLWDYQQAALQNAIKALWKYYTEETVTERKPSFFAWYRDQQITLADLPLGKKRDQATLLSAYYPLQALAAPTKGAGESVIAAEHFVNRLGFWMATGSGKTLVLIKLIEVLWTLMGRDLIPQNDILVLTHREDLLRQLREQINEFNTLGGLYIRLKDLKEYAEVKRSFPSLLGHQEITIFYYRSDNLSDIQKERIVNFRNYENLGRWYLLLDEAHKGDKEDSKRQHIYSILSRNGFLFNFSATFTDPRDILTTAHEFNLASFIAAGYGKHLVLLTQENRAFRKDEDFTDEEKQKIVLQSLLVLTYIHKARQKLCEAAGAELYHRPLLLALVNSVNTESADLKLFFAQLERIAKGELGRDAFSRAKNDLWQEWKAEPAWLYEGTHFTPDQSLFISLTMQDILQAIFNADSYAAIEVLVRPSNNQELAFKLKSTAAPFALIRIGDTSKWQKEMLAGYELVEGFSDESFFQKLNADDSTINLLMGSRSFYEGWDSNRPNVITFINIGTGAEAKKFILQSVGRGVRLQPMPGIRKRLAALAATKSIDHWLYTQAKPFLPAVETLFIFGTNRTALESVLRELDQEQAKEEGIPLPLVVNQAAIQGQPLLIPTYQDAGQPLIDQRAPRKFELPQTELESLQAYLAYLGDERLLLAHHNLAPRQIGAIQKSLNATESYFNTAGGRKFGNMNILLPRLTHYLDILPKELQGFKSVENEINHYQHIRVMLQDVEELRRKVKAVQAYQEPTAQKALLKERFQQGRLDLDGYTAAIEQLAQSSNEESFTPPRGATLKIKHIATHYYLPLLLSEEEKIDYIRHNIQVESEVRFIKQLEAYLKTEGNLFKSFDWWMFSRTDETLDKVSIPYYDPTQNKMRDFHPDFVFWLRRWNDYFIVFIDPKGMRIADYQYKVAGYQELFTDPVTGEMIVFKQNDLNVRVSLALYTADANQAPLAYKDFWYDHPKSILQRFIHS